MFVGFGIDADLGEHGLDGRSLRRDQVMAGEFAIPTAPQRLAIDRDLREGGGVDAALNPPREDRFELLGIEPPHGARPGGNRGRFVASEAPGVGLGCAVLSPESGDAHEAVATQEHGQGHHPQDRRERVDATVRAARIGQGGERLQQRERDHRHLPARENQVTWNTHSHHPGQDQKRKGPDQHDIGELDLSLGLGPEDGGVRFEAMEQSCEGIVGGRIGVLGLNLGRFKWR